MDRLAFNAAAAINEQRLSRQMTTNELANVTTVGFKRSYEVAMRAINVEGPGLSTRLQPQSVSSDVIQLKPGPIMATGGVMDVAMNDTTVLAVSAPNGELAFTRRGDLRVNTAGVLENSARHVVRGQGGGAITIPPGLDISINPDGSVFAIDRAQAGVAQPILIDRLLMRDASTTPLERRQDGLFGPVGKLGGDITDGPVTPSLTPRALEGSNVNAMEVMVKLMDQSRSFEHQVRNIKETKTIDESGATMMKLG
ncbi:MAG: flagellar basal body rod C-terminal domain-containing protein [Polaromonas sp.]|jgi:flagellar basal-body rod protein FlgF|nr:flagellar basal body rod C-terminal domain-containing protein [Polaromonas sp.]